MPPHGLIQEILLTLAGKFMFYYKMALIFPVPICSLNIIEQPTIQQKTNFN